MVEEKQIHKNFLFYFGSRAEDSSKLRIYYALLLCY